jgi:hypothetical protein
MVVDSKIVRLRGKMKVPMQEQPLEFDSNQPNDDPIVKSLTALAGKSVRLVLAPQGTITEVRGVDDLMKGFELPGDASKEAAGLMRQAFSDESMKKAFGNMFGQLPAAPVGVGDTWSLTSDLDAGGLALTTSTTYKVSAIDADGVDVTIEGTITKKPQESAPAPAESDLAAKMRDAMGKITIESGIISGRGRLSRRDGMSIHQNLTSGVVITMPLPNSDQTMKMQQSMKASWERVAGGDQK